MSDAGTDIRRQENHFLRTACAIFLLFFVYTHYVPEYYICGINVNDMIFGMGRFAIPVFFLISGYFTYSKDGHSEARLWPKLLHIVYLIIFIKVAYLIIDIIYSIVGNTKIDWEYTLIEFVSVRDTTLHLWFVLALFLSYAIWLIFYKLKIDFKWTMAIGIPLLIVDMLFCEILPMIYLNTGIGWDTQHYGELTYPFISIAFFGFGYYMHKYKDRIDAKVSNNMILWMLVLGTIMAYFEVMWVVTSGINRSNLFFNSFILAFAIFYGSFRLREDQLRCRPLEFMGKDLLPWYYAMFSAAIFFTQNVLLVSFDRLSFVYNGLGPFIAMLVDLIAALFIWWLMGCLSRKMAKKKAQKTVNIGVQSTD